MRRLPRENVVWSTLRGRLVGQRDLFLMRVENSAMPGTPDVYWTRHGAAGWIELKLAAGDSASDNIGVPGVSREQLLWHRIHFRAGGLSCILARGRRCWIHVPGRLLAEALPSDGRTSYYWPRTLLGVLPDPLAVSNLFDMLRRRDADST